MQKLDLNRMTKYRVNRIVNEQYGGFFDRKEKFALGGVGAGGFIFEEGNGDDFVHFRVNLERLKNGLAIYLSNLEERHLLLCNFEEVHAIRFYKEADRLVHYPRSMFKWLVSKDIDYFKAKYVLLDKEIEQDHVPRLSIELKDYQALQFYLHKSNPTTAMKFLSGMSEQIPVFRDIQTYVWV